MRMFFALVGLVWACTAHANLLDLSAHGSFKKIYFVPEPEANSVEVRVFVPVGEVDRTGPEGLAHYLEHLVTWSADKVHGEGLLNREANAWTSPVWTSYWNRGPVEAFENMIRNARAVFEPVDLPEGFMLSERDIVEREFDLRDRDDPTAVLFREAYHHLYGDHGLGRSVMGTPESIRQISPEEALEFHERRYRPQDSYMLIYGPITKREAVAQIERHLVNLPEPAFVERGFTAPLPAPAERPLTLLLPKVKRDQVLIVGQFAPPPGLVHRKLWFSLLLLQDVLNSTHRGGLSKPLYYDSFTVTTVSARLFLLPTGSIGFEIFFSPEDGVSTQEATDRVHEVMHHLAVNGLPSDTVNAIQSQTREEVRRLEKDLAIYQATIAQSSILNLGEALDVKAYHYELGRPNTRDLNSILQAMVDSQFTTSAVAHREETQ